MLFRTGSSLIGGNCTEKILRFVFDFIADILHEEYPRICLSHPLGSPSPIQKPIKQRRKMVFIDSAQYASWKHNANVDQVHEADQVHQEEEEEALQLSSPLLVSLPTTPLTPPPPPPPFHSSSDASSHSRRPSSKSAEKTKRQRRHTITSKTVASIPEYSILHYFSPVRPSV